MLPAQGYLCDSAFYVTGNWRPAVSDVVSQVLGTDFDTEKICKKTKQGVSGLLPYVLLIYMDSAIV